MANVKIEPRRRVERVVWELNGPKVLSEALGLHPNAVNRWQRLDRIPSRWQPKLLDLAAKHGVGIRLEDLVG